LLTDQEKIIVSKKNVFVSFFLVNKKRN